MFSVLALRDAETVVVVNVRRDVLDGACAALARFLQKRGLRNSEDAVLHRTFMCMSAGHLRRDGEVLSDPEAVVSVWVRREVLHRVHHVLALAVCMGEGDMLSAEFLDEVRDMVVMEWRKVGA